MGQRAPGGGAPAPRRPEARTPRCPAEVAPAKPALGAEQVTVGGDFGAARGLFDMVRTLGREAGARTTCPLSDTTDPDQLTPPAAAPPPLGALTIAEPVGREPSLWYLAAAGGLYAGLLLALVSATDAQFLERADADPWTFLWLQALDDGLLTGVALLFGWARYPGSWWAMGLRGVPPRWWLFGGLGGGLAATLGWLTGLALERWGTPLPPHPIETLLMRAEGSHELAVVLLAVTVPVAIAEEIFFRGYAYRLLRARLGVAVAIVGSAVLFAAVHGLELGAWLPVLPVGLVFAVLAELSGSVVPGMIGHAVVNALAVLIG